MVRVGRGPGVGSSVESGELESAQRNTSHFSGGYTDVTGSRAIDTEYTNGTTARAVVIHFITLANQARGNIFAGTASADVQVGWGEKNEGTGNGACFALIAPGKKYKATSAASAAIGTWLEMDL